MSGAMPSPSGERRASGRVAGDLLCGNARGTRRPLSRHIAMPRRRKPTFKEGAHRLAPVRARFQHQRALPRRYKHRRGSRLQLRIGNDITVELRGVEGRPSRRAEFAGLVSWILVCHGVVPRSVLTPLLSIAPPESPLFAGTSCALVDIRYGRPATGKSRRRHALSRGSEGPRDRDPRMSLFEAREGLGPCGSRSLPRSDIAIQKHCRNRIAADEDSICNAINTSLLQFI